MKDDTLTPMKPEELLKEKDWDKIIREEVQVVISKRIDVLNQQFNKDRQIQKRFKLSMNNPNQLDDEQ